ncbi:MAG: hypothetical protein Q9168_000967 [Polycauliona sp. 1 TL-2023]
MSQKQDILEVFWQAIQDPEFLNSIKSHKRYHLRLVAIISIDVGLFFNILAVCLAHDKIINGLAFIPLVISLIWNVFDLVANRLYQHGIPLQLLAWVDLLGFVSFLVFLIVSGVLCGENEHDTSVAMLRAYTSVPWMFCCIIHGLIVAQFVLPYPFGNLHLHPVCPDCHRDWKPHGGATRDGETYALLRDADEMEAQAGTSGRLDDNATPRAQRKQTET